MKQTTIDQKEVNNFSALSEQWWDARGPFKPLHDLTPARITYLKEQICAHSSKDINSATALKGLSILDIGCGGGLVCEPLARLGADVTGIDASAENIGIATEHAKQSGLKISYKNTTSEEEAQKRKKYDVVLALEIIEHVADIDLFVKTALECLKKDGLIIFSTLNRTPKSYALGIVAAEYILRWVPKGTHSWKKFVKPSELTHLLEKHGAHLHDVRGLTYRPLAQSFDLSKDDLSVNYFLTAKK